MTTMMSVRFFGSLQALWVITAMVVVVQTKTPCMRSTISLDRVLDLGFIVQAHFCFKTHLFIGTYSF